MTPDTVRYVAHDALGNIVRTGEVPGYALAAQQFDAAGVVEGEGGPTTHYVEDGFIKEKAPSEIVQAGAVFSNIPEGAWADVNGERYDIDDGIAEFEFDFPGTYSVTIYSTRYLPLTAQVVQA